MNIVELRAQSFKRLKVVAIRPEGSVVVLAGENGQGKTSVLGAIMSAIKGKAAAGPTPIREGEEECRIKLDMGELVVIRSFTKGADGEITTKVVVKNADGTKPQGTPQAILDALVGSLSLDPLAFGKWDAKRQFDAVSGLVKGFDFAEHDRARKIAFEDRTDWNRRVKENEAAAAKVILPEGPKPEPVVIADVLHDLQVAETHNTLIDQRAERRKQESARADNLFEEAERLRARAATLEAEAEEIEKKIAESDPLPAKIDTAPFKTRLATAERVGAARRAHEQREAFEKAAERARTEAQALTDAIAKRDAAKAAAIAATKMPVEGLDLSDGRVLLNGLPFSEAGTSERIRAGMAIAAALNPKLRVILADEGSELDPKSMKLVQQFASEHAMQVWVTRCSHDSGLPEVEIHDGEVA